MYSQLSFLTARETRKDFFVNQTAKTAWVIDQSMTFQLSNRLLVYIRESTVAAAGQSLRNNHKDVWLTGQHKSDVYRLSHLLVNIYWRALIIAQ